MAITPRLVLLTITLAGSCLAGATSPALAQGQAPPIDLTAMSLEELLRIDVTTASKKSESLFDAPAIMVVLTERDIQSYGGRSLVEVLDRTTSVFFMGTQENLQGALTMRGDATLGSNSHILLDEKIYYAEYTAVNVNSIPGRPGRGLFVGATVGF